MTEDTSTKYFNKVADSLGEIFGESRDDIMYGLHKMGSFDKLIVLLLSCKTEHLGLKKALDEVLTEDKAAEYEDVVKELQKKHWVDPRFMN